MQCVYYCVIVKISCSRSGGGEDPSEGGNGFGFSLCTSHLEVRSGLHLSVWGEMVVGQAGEVGD